MFILSRRILKDCYQVLSNTISAYSQNNVPRLGAALAYYTIFSLPALLIMIIAILNSLYVDESLETQIFTEIGDMLGAETQNQISSAVEYLTQSTADSTLATIIGILALVYVATNIFFILQEALNTIFEVQSVPPKMSIVWFVINRVISLGMIIIFCAILMTAILINTIVANLTNFIAANHLYLLSKFPDYAHYWLDLMQSSFVYTLRTLTSIFLLTCFFFLIYYVLPAIQLRFKYTLIGSIVVAILFWIGQELLTYYLSTVAAISAYGAAGSIIVLLLWVYYSAQLLFLGGAFIKSLLEYKQCSLSPKKYARMLHNHGNKK